MRIINFMNHKMPHSTYCFVWTLMGMISNILHGHITYGVRAYHVCFHMGNINTRATFVGFSLLVNTSFRAGSSLDIEV